MNKRTAPPGYVLDENPETTYGDANSWYQLVGPLCHATTDEPGNICMAFYSEQRYISSMKRVHGGMLASFVDYLLFGTARTAWGSDTALATVSLNINYVSACPPDVWVYGHGQTVRAGKNMAFVTGEVRAEDKVIVHANGTFRKLC